MRSRTLCTGWSWLIPVMTLCGATSAADGAAFVQLHPVKDGTLLDSGTNGMLDGIADEADWYFNDPPSSYEGTITRATASSHIEHRLVWEYSLATVPFAPPLKAQLAFTLRGAPAFPRPDVDVHVYTYPADLAESLADFSAQPAVFQDHVTIAPYQDPTAFIFDVSDAVSQALASGAGGVAFRFQVDPHTAHTINQAFMDAFESDPDTKPVLTVIDALPADADGNGLVDLIDHDWFFYCFSGPRSAPPPDLECRSLQVDFNDGMNDNDVDLRDFSAFQRFFGSTR